MTYWTRSILVAAVTLLVAAGCDSDSDSDQNDAGGGDAIQTEQADEPDTGSDDADTADSSPDAGDDRPAATASESGTIDEKPPLEIREFLPVEQIQKIDESREYTRSPLPGIEPSPNYNAFRIHPSQGDDYGAGLQVWKFEEEGKGGQRFDELKSQYLNVDPKAAVLEGLDAQGFASTRGGIQNVVVFAGGNKVVYALSCSKTLCDSPDKLRELVSYVHEELGG